MVQTTSLISCGWVRLFNSHTVVFGRMIGQEWDKFLQPFWNKAYHPTWPCVDVGICSWPFPEGTVLMGQLVDLCTVLKNSGVFHHSLVFYVQAGSWSTSTFMQTISKLPGLRKKVFFFNKNLSSLNSRGNQGKKRHVRKHHHYQK